MIVNFKMIPQGYKKFLGHQRDTLNRSNVVDNYGEFIADQPEQHI